MLVPRSVNKHPQNLLSFVILKVFRDSLFRDCFTSTHQFSRLWKKEKRGCEKK